MLVEDDGLTRRGSAVAKITAENLKEHETLFHPVLNLWVHEEMVNGEKLSQIINTKRENVKYAPPRGDRGQGLMEGIYLASSCQIISTRFPISRQLQRMPIF